MRTSRRVDGVFAVGFRLKLLPSQFPEWICWVERNNTGEFSCLKLLFFVGDDPSRWDSLV